MAKKGIDISEHQEKVDFTKVKNEVDFVILREGYRQTIDKYFMTNVKGCKANNIELPGVYHFLYPLCEHDVIAEAKSCIKNMEAAGLDKSVRIWCDLEYDTIDYAKKKGVTIGKTQINEWTKMFCDYVVSQGYMTGVYTNCDYYINYYEKSVLQKYPIWLADYTGDPDFDCIMHQYSSKGVVAGISGDVDMNYCYSADKEELDTMIFNPDTVINIAIAEEGYVEKASNKDLDSKSANPGSANYTKYNRDMHAIYPEVMDFPAPWCDAFVDWCFYKAYGICNAKSLLCGNFDDYTVASAALFKKKNAYYDTPEKGDQVFFNYGSGIAHTGLVIGVNYTTRKFTTEEGNSSNKVARRTYSFDDSTVDGFGRPPYGMVSPYPTTEVPNSSSISDSLYAQAQMHLNRFINAKLDVDGDVGELTLKAYRKAVQLSLNMSYGAGLDVDGEAGELTEAALQKVVIREGDINNLVTTLEIGLLMHGIDPKGVEYLGIFGSGLSNALGIYQEREGLDVDYEAGYATFMSLMGY